MNTINRRQALQWMSTATLAVTLPVSNAWSINKDKMNWTKTSVTFLLGIEYPIIQGPFGGGLSSKALVSAVSNAGGLGSYGVHIFTADEIIALDKEIKDSTQKPYALNLWVSDRDERLESYSQAEYEQLQKKLQPYFDELGVPFPEIQRKVEPSFEQQVEAVLKVKPPVFSFVFGIPSKEILKDCKKQGIKTIGAATTLDEALELEGAGVDMIVASGAEAGGHRVSFLRPAEDSLTGTLALVPQVVDKVKVPVIAAGGIADGRGIAAALSLGAAAVQIGTAFLACKQSNAPSVHKENLFSDKAKYTTLTRAFSGRLARGMVSRLSDDMKDVQKEMAPFPLQSYLISKLRAAAIAQGKTDVLTFWCGQAAPLLQHTDANELFSFLVKDTHRVLQSL